MTVYASFLYFHLALNIVVAAYFLIMITSTADEDIVKLCQEGLRADQTQDQCTGLLNIAKATYWVVAILGLAVEACESFSSRILSNFTDVHYYQCSHHHNTMFRVIFVSHRRQMMH